MQSTLLTDIILKNDQKNELKTKNICKQYKPAKAELLRDWRLHAGCTKQGMNPNQLQVHRQS